MTFPIFQKNNVTNVENKNGKYDLILLCRDNIKDVPTSDKLKGYYMAKVSIDHTIKLSYIYA